MNKYGDKAIEILNELHTECLEYHSEYLPLIKCANRCAEYESTGLTPNQLTKAAALYKAQEEGRLVELPCKLNQRTCADTCRRAYGYSTPLT